MVLGLREKFSRFRISGGFGLEGLAPGFEGLGFQGYWIFKELSGGETSLNPKPYIRTQRLQNYKTFKNHQ